MVAPLEDATPVAHAASGFLVTLWHRFEGSTGVRLAPEELAESLRSLHAELARTKSELPSFRVAIDNARTALDEDSFMAALDLDSRTFLRDVYDEGLARLDEIETKEQRLHGEPHAGNRMLGPEGLRWLDFEDCCTHLGRDRTSIGDHAPGRVGSVRCRGIDLSRNPGWSRRVEWMSLVVLVDPPPMI